MKYTREVKPRGRWPRGVELPPVLGIRGWAISLNTVGQLPPVSTWLKRGTRESQKTTGKSLSSSELHPSRPPAFSAGLSCALLQRECPVKSGKTNVCLSLLIEALNCSLKAARTSSVRKLTCLLRIPQLLRRARAALLRRARLRRQRRLELHLRG